MADHEQFSAPISKDVRLDEPHNKTLPRSILRRDFELLNGVWCFELDRNNRGLQEHWYLGHQYSDTSQWPSSIEEHISKAQRDRKERPWSDYVAVWYEREFVIPERWQVKPDYIVQLTFGACGYETRVWLNGHLLRTIEGAEAHFGKYTSFSYELPNGLLQAENRLTVRVADSMDTEIPRGKQESRIYKRGGIWYQTISGAVRDIWLEPIERNFLRSRLTVSSQIESNIVQFYFTTLVHDPGLYKLTLTTNLLGSDQPATIAEYQLPLGAGEKSQWIPLQLPDAALWSLDSPNLYRLIAELVGPDGQPSLIESRFGLRKVEARDNCIYLNNEPIYLDGILYQPGTSNLEQMRRHMLAMKQLGCNLVRVHIIGIDPRVCDLADELGMLLWLEVPSPHTSSEVSRANHRAELQRLLTIMGSHPSIIIWSLYNEDWGVQDIATSANVQKYIAETYDFMRLNYPQLLVVDNDGWRHVSMQGRLKSDLLTVHLYTTDIDRWRSLLSQLIQGRLEGVTHEDIVVGDQFFYRQQIPLIISEWGGFGFSEYGGPQSYAARNDMIRAFKTELRKHHLAGDVYTQAINVEDEVNGLIDAETGRLLVDADLFASGD
jgi:beta-galactosidase/beta-glucuronidase